MSTVMPTARGLLSMATYKALPDRFGHVNEASSTPKFATWVIGLTSLAIYCVLDVISDSVVEDSVYSVGDRDHDLLLGGGDLPRWSTFGAPRFGRGARRWVR